MNGFKAVALDVTADYNIDPNDRPYITKILDVFVFDSGEHTYCCEGTPSYWLEPLYTTIHFAENTPDDIRDRLDDKYCHEATDGCYVHVSQVAAMSDQVNLPARVLAETLEDAREYWQGNCPF